MRRLALLAAGGALWLFAAAIPALADGGPHIAAINNGSAGLTSDNCAGCHRAHTAQAAMLLKEDGTALCTTCHGSAGTGATTNVADGVQYQLDTASTTTVRGALLGALRGGGFDNARIGSTYPTRLLVSLGASNGLQFTALVPALTSGTPVTSKHMSLTGSTAATAWGNGPINGTADPGATVTLECTSCHNPHGNGQYRILKPMPFGPPDTTPPGFTAAAAAAPVTDAPLTAGIQNGTEARNYTVAPGTLTTNVNGAVAADYWHWCSPSWDNCSGANAGDKPNGLVTFKSQISAWCSTCHSRYLAGSQSATNFGGPSGDAIFAYRHTTNTVPPCTSCHVSHGSNAQMTGFNSTHEAYPGGGSDPTATANPDSRLLKVDNRGTCELCHDPTHTFTSTTPITPVPVPLILRAMPGPPDILPSSGPGVVMSGP